MEFSFEVDPSLDIAVGTELSFEVNDDEFGVECLADMDPLIPTEAKPGSEDKVRMLAARYAAGVPLWHNSDCYDHGPADIGLADEDGASFEEEEDF